MKISTLLPALLLFAPSVARAEVPPVFVSELGFQAGVERAKAEGKLFLLDAMTSWCGPCKTMDRTTWVDERLVSWMNEHVIAIQLDMDEHAEVKAGLDIDAFPTIVVFRDGEEFDRVVGLRDAAGMLGWMKDARAGKTGLDRVKRDLEAARAETEGEALLHRRGRLAGQLLAYGEYAEALTEFLWLWEKTPELASGPGRPDPRHSTHAHRIATLVEEHFPARVAFARLRDELTEATFMLDAPDLSRIGEWITLNRVLGEETTTVRWADARTHSDQGLAVLQQLGLFDLLVEHGRWRAAGHALLSPVERLKRKREDLHAFDPQDVGADVRPVPKSMPAIPMTGGMKPAQPVDAGTSDEDEPKRETIPAIPMTGGMKPAKKTDEDEEPKTIPAIPMTGGMKPAQPTDASAPSDEVLEEVKARLNWHFVRTAGEYYGALLAAGRNEEASECAEILLAEFDDAEARASLLSHALKAGQFDAHRERHARWLEESWR